jgi:glyoxylase-like metal-dependent hydrolase (beta-lactamase superfamily II)
VQIGRYTVRAIDAGRFRLDGGAMHGVVPRTLWAPLSPPDAENRVEYATRCLLIESPDRRVLVETGNGDKWTPRQMEMYGIEPGAGIARRLAALGVEPDTIDTVVLTHLHFDHAGGATFRDASGAPVPTFARARHVVQRRELEDALAPHERNRASYLPDSVRPLIDAGLAAAVEGEREVAPGVRVVPTPGHTAGHQSVLLDADGERVFLFGDVVPTAVHLRLPWIMAYDLEPAVTLETKRALIERAVREGWIVAWGHDAERVAARLRRDGAGQVVVAEAVDL